VVVLGEFDVTGAINKTEIEPIISTKLPHAMFDDFDDFMTLKSHSQSLLGVYITLAFPRVHQFSSTSSGRAG
jgi:hypothetical protein